MSGIDRTVVVGGGVFGLTAAIELRRRGRHVVVVDPGPIPHPLAASTDISKVVRIEYGADPGYAGLAEEARHGWLAWNRDLFEDPLYHETGATFLTRRPMAAGGYEFENYRSLIERGHLPQRLGRDDIRARLPAWNADAFADGYFNPHAGYVESGRVVERLARLAVGSGVELRPGAEVDDLLGDDTVEGVRLASGERISAADVVVAAGAWTPLLVPELEPYLKPIGQPVFHLRPCDPEPFSPPRFFVFGADSARTGWYGFPAHPSEGVVKIANHGPGWAVHPKQNERAVPHVWFDRLQELLAEAIPDLSEAPVVMARCCLYCDTADEHFWIARHPRRTGLMVAAGDSGHAFKFAPVLGALIADIAEGQPHPLAVRFAWREGVVAVGEEASRYRGGR